MQYDFFLSRRGTVAAVAQDVTAVLEAKGYRVIVQDYDIPLTANFVLAMHEAIKNARDLVVLFTADYETSPHTRNEFTSFEADRAQSAEPRRVIILRCEDVPLRGLFAPHVYQDLVGIDDPRERETRILAAIAGASQAHRPAPRPFVGVPPRIQSFKGRGKELDRLDEILAGRGGPDSQIEPQIGRAAIRGMGGVGKTALAMEYAYRYRALYAGIWWCPAETRTGLLAALAGMAKDLGATAAEADIEQSAKAGLRRLAEQPATYLLVYDNAGNPGEFQDLLPASGARILITSRFADWDGWADEIPLDVLEPAEAVAFLESRSGRSDAQGANTLANALGCLPLALDHAAAYCKRTQTAFSQYANNAVRLIVALPTGAIYPRSVRATFDFAIAGAIAQSPAADMLMAYLAQCSPERIPLELLDGAIDDQFERTEALLAITDMSLVKRDPFEDATPAVTIHRLVRSIAQDRAAANATAAPALSRLFDRLFALYPKDGRDDPKLWSACQRLTPHILAQPDDARFSAAPPAERAMLLNRAGNYLHGRGEYARALPLLTEALTVREQNFGAGHPYTARSLNNVANLLQDQGRFDEAVPLRERALAIFEAELGPNDPFTATALNNLGFLLQAKGDLVRARTLYERAVAICEAALGPADPDTAISVNNLGTLLQAQGELTQAEDLLSRALAIRETALGAEHPYTALSLGNLARNFELQGKLDEAKARYMRALAIREAALGAEHPDTATSLIALGRLTALQGDYGTARSLCGRGLAIRERVLGPEHPLTIEARSTIPA